MEGELSSRDGVAAFSLRVVLSGRVRKKAACASDGGWEGGPEGCVGDCSGGDWERGPAMAGGGERRGGGKEGAQGRMTNGSNELRVENKRRNQINGASMQVDRPRAAASKPDGPIHNAFGIP